jgi:protein CpxP
MKKLGKFKILAIATLSAIALAATIAVAQTVKTARDNGQRSRGDWHGRGERKDHGWGGMQGAFLQRLNLTDDQKAKIKQIRESAASGNKPLREQLQAKRQELRQATEGGTFDEALVTQKLTEMAGLQAKLMGEEFKLHQAMQSVLTAEQKAQLEQLKAQFKTREGQRPRRGEQRDNE